MVSSFFLLTVGSLLLAPPRPCLPFIFLIAFIMRNTIYSVFSLVPRGEIMAGNTKGGTQWETKAARKTKTRD